jgi:uncharacterized phosphosugar-binding protein
VNNTLLQEYMARIREMLDRVEQTEKEAMTQAAVKVADCIQNNGIVHLFGCGHSHILTEEVFYRAGGLVPLHPILYEPLMLHEGAVRSSQLERENGLAGTFMDAQDIRCDEVFFVLSTSGRNAVPIDVALIAKERGAYTIGITSLEYAQSQPARHISGKRLYEVVDLILNNYAVKGDAVLSHPNVSVPFAPTSTVTGAVMLNAILAESIRVMAERGFEPPIFLSGNIDGSDRHNAELIARYRERIPLLS